MFLFLVIVTFPLDESPDVSVLAWTTTPWTLPSNVSLCVHPDMDYVKIKGMSKMELQFNTIMHLYSIFMKLTKPM